jgi:hypothetical protein
VLTGKEDHTICFHCGKGLKGWEEKDEPWSEHAVWFPTCLYVIHIKGMKFIQRCRALKAGQEVEVCTDLIYYRSVKG